ncbi:MAG: UTP--glucose-1-phosphate uridylyltransferase [Planctomycetota bacterium]
MPIDLAIVPVAGQGTRMLPLTKSQPKEMLPVGGKPAVQYVVEELAESGIRRLLFITGPGKDSIENHFDIDSELIALLRETGKEELLAELEFERRNLEYFYTRQRRQLGLGHAVLCARSFVGEQPFVVALGDSIIGVNAQSDIVARMVEEFEKSGADAVVAIETVPIHEVQQYGVAKPRTSDGPVFLIEDLIEKPSPEEAPSNLTLAARYVLGPAIFECLSRTQPDRGGQVQLTDALRLLIQGGGRVLGMRLAEGETRHDIGDFENYFRSFVEFALADGKYGAGLRNYLIQLLQRTPGN